MTVSLLKLDEPMVCPFCQHVYDGPAKDFVIPLRNGIDSTATECCETCDNTFTCILTDDGKRIEVIK